MARKVVCVLVALFLAVPLVWRPPRANACGWLRDHPEDPRLPEALHLAVRSTRWGQGDEQNSSVSRAAFLFLHKHYPNSEWTKKTTYWFK